MEEKKDEKLEKALLKVALGFQVAEVTEEYAEVDGQLRLTKRKKTKKEYKYLFSVRCDLCHRIFMYL